MRGIEGKLDDESMLAYEQLATSLVED